LFIWWPFWVSFDQLETKRPSNEQPLYKILKVRQFFKSVCRWFINIWGILSRRLCVVWSDCTTHGLAPLLTYIILLGCKSTYTITHSIQYTICHYSYKNGHILVFNLAVFENWTFRVSTKRSGSFWCKWTSICRWGWLVNGVGKTNKVAET